MKRSSVSLGKMMIRNEVRTGEPVARARGRVLLTEKRDRVLARIPFWKKFDRMGLSARIIEI
jgi:hypothetical protein